MNKEEELGNRARQFAECLLSDNQTYHNHKETMAHACVVLEIAIFGWIMSDNGWEIATGINKKLFLFLFTVVWLMLHLYIRWQLRYRRWAAKQDAGIRRMLGEWTYKSPTKEQLQPYKESTPKPPSSQILIDWFIPNFCGGHLHDLAAKNYPIQLVESIKEASSEKDNSLYIGEWLVTILSMFLFLIVFFRKLWDC